MYLHYYYFQFLFNQSTFLQLIHIRPNPQGRTSEFCIVPLDVYLWSHTQMFKCLFVTVWSVPAVTKDIFVWTVGPQRSANYFNCAI